MIFVASIVRTVLTMRVHLEDTDHYLEFLKETYFRTLCMFL